MTSEKKEFLFLFFTYSAVIAATLFWSGYVTSPSVYDRYLARVEGVSFEVKNSEKARSFYLNVLNYQPAHADGVVLLLPDKKKLFLKPSANPRPSEIILRVRNGFPKLYEFMRSQLADPKNAGYEAKLSEMVSTEWGDEFVLTDSDENRFVYFRPRRKSLTRGE